VHENLNNFRALDIHVKFQMNPRNQARALVMKNTFHSPVTNTDSKLIVRVEKVSYQHYDDSSTTLCLGFATQNSKLVCLPVLENRTSIPLRGEQLNFQNTVLL
jgi:hypothetical protein